ncbi:helix-turn-helix transcriptional regulator [Solibacillus sp. FSL K6-1523]|uniref:helix-turn-helix transcriptional regulator n=1 Tax=Solibacillus sp. FSL K6-1523 TaxID=2921471 RepID=UPI0030F94A5B
MFAEVIKARRIELGLSHQDVANCVGIERSYYTKIENGLKPSVKVAQLIAKTLGGFEWTIFFNEICVENAQSKIA